MFSAVITPHRSLGKRGFRLVMTLVCLATIVSSIPFMVLGAWPVAGFFGLDLLALYIAFRVNFAQARAMEEVVVSRIEVLVRQVSPKGEAREWRFNPAWTRMEEKRDDEFGVLGLALVSRGQSVTIASQLSPAERESFADAFRKALAEARR
ncbi:MAG: DUF2244 domain-containing protein [Bosea sp. (in: a-proteobacteria)]